MSLSHEQLQDIAKQLHEAENNRTMIPRLTATYPEMTVEDSYAVQGQWVQRKIDDGEKLVGRKIGLTSKVMQEATGITEPDYGAIFEDQIFENGSTIQEHAQFSNVRIEVELAFVLKEDLSGPNVNIFDVMRATEYVVPALETLSSRIEMEGRTIVDTISDNAALGAMVYGGNPVAPDAVDLRWVSALLYRNESIEDTGVAAAVLNHPAMGVAWLANKLHAHGETLKAGEIILAETYQANVVHPGVAVHADYCEWEQSHADSSRTFQTFPERVTEHGTRHRLVCLLPLVLRPTLKLLPLLALTGCCLMRSAPYGLEDFVTSLLRTCSFSSNPSVPVNDTVLR